MSIKALVVVIANKKHKYMFGRVRIPASIEFPDEMLLEQGMEMVWEYVEINSDWKKEDCFIVSREIRIAESWDW